MPFTFTVTDTASINVTMTVNQNATNNDLYDINVTAVYLVSLLSSGTNQRLLITHPTNDTNSNITQLVSTIALPLSGTTTVARVRSETSVQNNFDWTFTLQYESSPSVWTSVSQVSSGVVYQIYDNGTSANYNVEVIFSGSESSIVLKKKVNSAPLSLSIGGTTYNSIIDAGITYDFQLILPEQNGVGNQTYVDDIINGPIPATPAVDLTGYITSSSGLRGTAVKLFTTLNWSRVVIKDYYIGLTQTVVDAPNFTKDGVTYTIATTSNIVNFKCDASLTAASQTTFASISIAVL